ncbi:MAG: catalase family protein [Proteobacteria bacterium]|nr:catalase family protein [Pseudomonadota bacterium]
MTTISRSERRASHLAGMLGIALSCSLIFLAACSRQDLPGIAEERVPPGEAAEIERVVSMFTDAIEARDDGELTRRGAHPKHHGCVHGNFAIDADLPAELQVGVFQAGASYPVWIRFSNNADPQADIEADVRGMALKLLEVDGSKLFEPDPNARTQDFLLVSHPVFVFPDVATYSQAFEAFADDRALSFFFNPFDSHLRAFMIVREMLARHADLLDLRWFSMVAYRFGDGRAVKYSASPCVRANTPLPQTPPDDFLARQLGARLAADDACFEFSVQFQSDAASMPIEDPSRKWSESRSPFIPVAKIEIPAQAFDSPGRMAFCENLSFNPWRVLPEHRPLGGISRARRVIYDEISKFRRDRNRIVADEPRNLMVD